jgi:hypothetical protein
VQELVDAIVGARVKAEPLVSAQPRAQAKLMEHATGLIEGKALRIAGQLNANVGPNPAGQQID